MMMFFATVRGFDVPEEILALLEKDGHFHIKKERSYFYNSNTFRTHVAEEIDAVLEQVLAFSEQYTDIFRAISNNGGNVELYITFYSRTSGGFCLPRSTIKRLSELNMSIGIDGMLPVSS